MKEIESWLFLFQRIEIDLNIDFNLFDFVFKIRIDTGQIVVSHIVDFTNV